MNITGITGNYAVMKEESAGLLRLLLELLEKCRQYLAASTCRAAKFHNLVCGSAATIA